MSKYKKIDGVFFNRLADMNRKQSYFVSKFRTDHGRHSGYISNQDVFMRRCRKFFDFSKPIAIKHNNIKAYIQPISFHISHGYATNRIDVIYFDLLTGKYNTFELFLGDMVEYKTLSKTKLDTLVNMAKELDGYYVKEDNTGHFSNQRKEGIY